MTKPWPEDLGHFMDEVEWTFAKTYAETWPHEYIVKDRVDQDHFRRSVIHIREHGDLKPFYDNLFIYFEQDGLIYWTMVPPRDNPGWYEVDQEVIINRAPVEGSYENRLRNGTLPSLPGN
jgi:hypothetical protein